MAADAARHRVGRTSGTLFVAAVLAGRAAASIVAKERALTIGLR